MKITVTFVPLWFPKLCDLCAFVVQNPPSPKSPQVSNLKL
jgi:hypothetical protein